MDETNAALGEAAGEQAVGCVRAVAGLGPVHVQDMLRLVRDVHQFGHGRLHPEGHFVGRNPRFNFGIVDLLIAMGVQPLNHAGPAAVAANR